VDHRLVRDRHIDQCSHRAATLYLFLVTVADAQGLSYYSDVTILQRLNMDDHGLAQARLELVRIGLIAYQKPIYQVLALDAFPLPITARTASSQPQLLGHIFQQILKEAP
jgi:hypothetical protein